MRHRSKASGQRGLNGHPGRRRERRRGLAGQENALALGAGYGDRRGRQKRPRIGVLRALKDRVARAHLDRMAEIDHQHVVGDVPHDREIVRDENVGELELLLQAREQVEHLGADRDVERRHRLVEHQDLRPQHNRTGDGDALPLAAGKHVRVAVIIFGPRPTFSMIASAAAFRSAALIAVLTSSGSSSALPIVWRGLSEP